MRFAILLDGGFLKRKLGSSTNPMIANQVVDFAEKFQHEKNSKTAHCTEFTNDKGHDHSTNLN